MSTPSEGSIYSNHAEQREAALPPEARVRDLEEALLFEFGDHVEYRQTPVILFDAVSAEDLGEALVRRPVMLKALLACANVAQRAVQRDLGITVDTYAERISRDRAFTLSGYLKPLLPKELAVPALLMLDHFWWVDKEMRAAKGRWERRVRAALNRHLREGSFVKRKFEHPGGTFELDAAYPKRGDVEVGVDVKRFESPRDFHKRGDEITQKVSHLRDVHPSSRFFAVIYYPFPDRHADVLKRYQGQGINGILFAAETESSIDEAAMRVIEEGGLLD
ncbi:hypothetical protein [Candidatus Palauibacter irciniicola]|uniref:hypothetical protein n=1 Tax=Candidatus Palauibacter irciniicola TaxID=3056733 RepID=UPI003B01D171